MIRTPIANIKGPRGFQGEQGVPGAPGVNGVPTDSAIAINVETPASETSLAVARVAARVEGPRPLVEPDSSFVFVPAVGHGWANTSTSSFVLQELGGPLSQHFLRFTTAVGSPVGYIQKAGLALDLTQRAFRVWVRLNMHAAHTLKFFAGNTGMTAFFEWTIQSRPDDEASKFVKTGDWTPVILNFADAVVTGAPSRAALTTLRLQTDSNAGSSGTVDLGGISLVPQAHGGVVSLTFDDSWVNHATVAEPIMTAKGYAGTAYTICDAIGSSSSFMTLTQLRQLQNAGWDVAAHASSLDAHATGFDVLTPTQLDAECRKSIGWLTANGFRGSDHLAFPMGRYTPAQARIIDSFFATARTTSGTTQEAIRPSVPSKLRSLYITNTTTVASVTAAIDRCRAEGTWLIICFHQIVTTPSAATHWATADFQAVIDYLALKYMTVLPVSEVVRRRY
jgi:hypothetical protein